MFYCYVRDTKDSNLKCQILGEVAESNVSYTLMFSFTIVCLKPKH